VVFNDFIFSDYDKDGLKDLILDWRMDSYNCFNTKGQFKSTEEFKNTEGWWNTVAEVDIDVVIWNFIFRKFKAETINFILLLRNLYFCGDNFDNTTYDMVLSKLYNGNLDFLLKNVLTVKFLLVKDSNFQKFCSFSLSIYGKRN
jgi:hypothetical protein